ncbi:16S rRNA (guanine(966)-N(2))-methyltransferase [Dickeya solani]|uniref:Ribosomal RNA small subunit methyltransferase D n=1 Tax=Dickeya solani TaxID=1089444 RepID=A0AAX4F1V9_9GAMM|nr:16S rRNA (guanine(966)-N(2))-methyltransferase [Dickeya solani]MCA7000857.1 16S rRNA (guanine(966)-N(2))-methyltransferase [Dickeya solani]MCZ0821801.1 16S rRNA (guanine(966)-N(2))-methyltransferase [Dickeya solani]MDV6994980.1 16S rRNA (guanine(966)-N(2))-methyltransferase [Dickeya solani]MDV7006399.1 16S rRNA (guanine(966)-N(2))-methyltransferase [Dickeya solani]MDV7036862.1 16S rRNA (guanine(966)-N(2))-methyltransferase [Dickeya solani]
MAKHQATSAPGQIRIIGGQWRGRKLPVPDSPGLRPTTDRVRETLFNWLAPVIQQSRCLDCFAGSGALGLEALSRYAAHATLLEAERDVARQLTQNLSLLRADNAEVVNADTLQWLAKPASAQPYDVVFLDPPFRRGLLDDTLRLLETGGWLAQETWIYIETEAENRTLAIPPTWTLHREKTAGQVSYRLYIRHVSDTTSGGNDEHLD